MSTVERELLCPHCQTLFTTTRRRQVYCSQECSAQALRDRLAQFEAEGAPARSTWTGGPRWRRPRSASCEWCTATFEPKRKEQRFCGPECVREAGQVRLEELRDAGTDPAHGGKAADVRREALSRRRVQHMALKGMDAAQRQYLARVVEDGRPIVIDEHDGTPQHIHFNLDGDAWRLAGERWSRLARGESVLTLTGHGSRLSVDKDALIVTAGRTHSSDEPATWRLERGTHKTEAIVIAGHSGTLSLDALQWCQDQGIAILALDRDSRLTSVVSPRIASYAELRRLQYDADALPLARALVGMKLRASAEARPQVRDVMEEHSRLVNSAPTLQAVRLLEGQAGMRYWEAWRLNLRWRGHAPATWQAFTQRESPIGSQSGARFAAHPVNAMLNLAYTILAGRIERACVTTGLDPAIGYLHADHDGRESLVWDLIEPLRAEVDRRLLSWVESTVWTRSDFAVDRTGVVRCHPALVRIVVERTALPEREIGDVVDWLIGTLRGQALGHAPSAVLVAAG